MYARTGERWNHWILEIFKRQSVAGCQRGFLVGALAFYIVVVNDAQRAGAHQHSINLQSTPPNIWSVSGPSRERREV